MKNRFVKTALSVMLCIAVTLAAFAVNAITTTGDDTVSAAVKSIKTQAASDELKPFDPATVVTAPEAEKIADAVKNGSSYDISWPTVSGGHKIELFTTPDGKVPYTFKLTGTTPNAEKSAENALGVVFAKDNGGVYVYVLSVLNTSTTLSTTSRRVYYVPFSGNSFATQAINISYLGENYNGDKNGNGNGSRGSTIIQAYEVLDSSYDGEVTEKVQAEGKISTVINKASTGKMSSLKIHETDTNVMSKQGYTLDKYSFKYNVRVVGDAIYIYTDIIFTNPDDSSMNHTWRTLTDCYSGTYFESLKGIWQDKTELANANLDKGYYGIGDHSNFTPVFGISVSPAAVKSGFKSSVTAIDAQYCDEYYIKNGIVKDSDGLRLYHRNSFLTGLQMYEGDYYLCDEDTGLIATSGTYEIDGVTFNITESGKFEVDSSQFDKTSKYSFYNLQEIANSNMTAFLSGGTSFGSDTAETYLTNPKGGKLSETDLVSKQLNIESLNYFVQTVPADTHSTSAAYTLRGTSEKNVLGIVVATDENGYYTYKVGVTGTDNIIVERALEYHRYADDTKSGFSTANDYTFNMSCILSTPETSDPLYANANRIGAKRMDQGETIYSTVKGGLFESGAVKANVADYPLTGFEYVYHMSVDSEGTITVYVELIWEKGNEEGKEYKEDKAIWATKPETFTMSDFEYATDASWQKYSTAASSAWRKYVAVTHNEIIPVFGLYKDISYNASNRLENVSISVKAIDAKFTTSESHVWRERIVAPTCTEDGYIYKVCDCGEIERVPSGVPATGHKYDKDKLVIVQQGDEYGSNTIMVGYCEHCGVQCYYLETTFAGDIVTEMYRNSKGEWVEIK